MKKLVSIICCTLSFVMAFSLLFSICAYASSASPTVTIQGGRYAVVSDDFSIAVNFDNMQGVKEGYFILKYNPDVLRYISSGVHDGMADSSSGATEIADGELKVGCSFASEDVSEEYCYPTFEVIKEGSLELSIVEGSFEKIDGTEAKVSYNYLLTANKSYAEEEIADAFFGGEISFNKSDIIYLEQNITVESYNDLLDDLTFANVYDVNKSLMDDNNPVSTGVFAMKYFSIKSSEEASVDYLGINFFAVKNDVNGDGKADVDDARAALRDSVGLENLNYVQRYAANKTGERLTVEDARTLLRNSVGLK